MTKRSICIWSLLVFLLVVGVLISYISFSKNPRTKIQKVPDIDTTNFVTSTSTNSKGIIQTNSHPEDILSVSGTQLLLNGKPFEVHGVQIDAFVATKKQLTSGNNGAPYTVYLNAYNHFISSGSTELKLAKEYGANTIEFKVSQSAASSDTYFTEVTNAIRLARSMGFVAIASVTNNKISGGENPMGVQLPTAVTQMTAIKLATLFKDDRGIMIELLSEPFGNDKYGWKEYIHGGSGYVGINQILKSVRNTGSKNMIIVEAAGQKFDAYKNSDGSYPHGQFFDPLKKSLIFGAHPYFHFKNVGITPASWDVSFGNFSRTHPVLITEWKQNTTKVGVEPTWCLPVSQGGLGAPINTPLKFLHYVKEHQINGVVAWAFDVPQTFIGAYGAGPISTMNGAVCGSVKGGIGEWLQDYFKGSLPTL